MDYNLIRDIFKNGDLQKELKYLHEISTRNNDKKSAEIIKNGYNRLQTILKSLDELVKNDTITQEKYNDCVQESLKVINTITIAEVYKYVYHKKKLILTQVKQELEHYKKLYLNVKKENEVLRNQLEEQKIKPNIEAEKYKKEYEKIHAKLLEHQQNQPMKIVYFEDKYHMSLTRKEDLEDLAQDLTLDEAKEIGAVISDDKSSAVLDKPACKNLRKLKNKGRHPQLILNEKMVTPLKSEIEVQ